ncbi:MAG: hypothetical protein KJ015_05225 [Myxococcales bacterium]|nr:hypothetical protein [Myxococcales bacterium]
MRRTPPLALLACLACAPALAPAPAPPASGTQAAPPAATLAAGPTLSGPPGSPSGAFAASPLTEFAGGVRDIALAALDGRPLPQGAIPVEPSRDPSRRVRSDKPPPPSRELDVFAFAMEITLVLREPSSTSADDPEDGSIELIAFLSRTGLKVAKLEARSPRSHRPLPVWLSGVERFGNEVLTALRGGGIGQLLVGEAERPVLSDDFLYRRLMDERPKLEQLRSAEALAARHGRVLGYRVDDVFLVSRDRAGVIWGLELELDESDGQVMLDGSPLVRVERLDKEERERLEAPPPPPPPPPPP